MKFRRLLEHMGMTPGDLQRAFGNMFGGKLRGQKIPIPGLEEMEIEKTPYDEAMDLVNEAFKVTLSLEKRRSLLNKAIEICPDCADAYLALGTMADFPAEILSFFQKAVAAGERYAGKESFENEVGHFWQISETRPYMQARKMLGDCLWMDGKQEEAILHYQDMLRLNPNDNQGIRHILIGWLIETGRNQEAKALLDQYPGDDFAAWPYSEALLAFRESGDDKTSRALLKKAKKENPFIFEYLSAPARIPEDLPEHYALGSEDEALIYLSEHLSIWENTPGALGGCINSGWVRAVPRPNLMIRKKTNAPKPC
jgi:tetratricopeptide (TPR) repeat protein